MAPQRRPRRWRLALGALAAVCVCVLAGAYAHYVLLRRAADRAEAPQSDAEALAVVAEQLPVPWMRERMAATHALLLRAKRSRGVQHPARRHVLALIGGSPERLERKLRTGGSTRLAVMWADLLAGLAALRQHVYVLTG